MKSIKIFITAATFSLVGSATLAQVQGMQQFWRDQEFVKQFAASFLPLTEQEPKITDRERTLFQELSVLFQAGQYQQAIQRLRTALAAVTGESEAAAALNYTLANLLLQDGQHAAAVVQYQEAIKRFPNFRRAYKNMGLASVQSADYPGSVRALVKAIELGDSSGETFGLLAFAYLNTGNATAALEGYRQASLLNPANVEWRIGKAEALMRTSRFQEAISEFKQLIGELPDRDAFYTSLANAHLSLNESSEASRYLEIVRRRGNASATVLGLLGDIYINENLPQLASSVYHDALKTGDLPTDRQIRVLRVMLQRGFLSDAEAFMAAVESSGSEFSDTESREVLNLRAQLALGLGQDAEAAEILERVIEQDPTNGNALMLLGNYNLGIGDVETALFFYERAQKLTSHQREAELQMARIYVREKEYMRAVRMLESVQQLQYSANVQSFLEAVQSIQSRAL